MNVSTPAPVLITTLPALASIAKPWKVKLLPPDELLNDAPNTTLPFWAVKLLDDPAFRLMVELGLKTILLKAVAL